jgi:hypothetical protein
MQKFDDGAALNHQNVCAARVGRARALVRASNLCAFVEIIRRSACRVLASNTPLKRLLGVPLFARAYALF